MLFNSIFQNVNVTLLCITNAPTMLYAACPEKSSFHSGGKRGGRGGLGPLFLNFLDPPLEISLHWITVAVPLAISVITNMTYKFFKMC